MKPSKRKRVIFGWFFLIKQVISFGLTSIFYWLFGKEIRLHGDPLEIDFFNTVFGILTIIGLAVAIFQLTDIKTEKLTPRRIWCWRSYCVEEQVYDFNRLNILYSRVERQVNNGMFRQKVPVVRSVTQSLQQVI